MCGIAGIVGLNGIADAEELARRMTGAMAHRGPDAEGIWLDPANVVLGHRRLGIIDPTPESNQPFQSADGRYVIVYNGELYNYRELKRELGDRPWRTNSDTEVLLEAYVRWGPECLDRCNGMFAIALWDKERKELFVARDRLGIKPVYTFEQDGRVLFASELRALLATGIVPRKLDAEALGDYLRYQSVQAPATIMKGVRMLLPGHWLRIREGRVETHCWWDPATRARREAAELSIADVRKEVRERLTKAVERRLVSDVPFGAFLSGGIDSSAIVGLMAEVSTDPVHTFSVVFDEEEFSEEKYAQIVAKKFRTEHTAIRLRPDEMVGMLPDVLASMDHPSGDGPNIYMVSQATKKAGITMALSGLGSDELFCGYPPFARIMALRKYTALAAMPSFIRRIGASAVSRSKFPKDYHTMAFAMQAGSVKVEHLYPGLRQTAPDAALNNLLASGSLPADRQIAYARELLATDKGGRLPVLSRISLLELTTYMQNTLLRDTDQMSMAHALEVRVPFLDHELVEFVLGVSDAHKDPGTTKRLLTSSLGDLLPDEVVHRPKMGFTLPWAAWMRGELRSFCAERIERLGQRALFNADGLRSHWTGFLEGNGRTQWFELWHLVVLEDWMERNGVVE